MHSKYGLVLLICIFFGCKQKDVVLISKSFDHSLFNYQGRIEKVNDSVTALISVGASVSIGFSGNQCEVYLKGEYKPYNYVSYELDGKYLGRFKIESDSILPYKINVPESNKTHVLKIYKESEVFNGVVFFSGIKAQKVLPANNNSNIYIEFIGNSITCGAASDAAESSCEIGEYFDHQNAYYAYGPRIARKLNVNFMLSSVSGIGIYRNWNDENIKEPIMPQVYENLYLNTDSTKVFNFSRKPDLVSICLGTNDLSMGDGIKPRLPFNKEKYITNYISFIKTIYKHYPNTQIALLDSPMSDGETKDLLLSCLEEIKSHFDDREKPIQLFQFSKIYNNGCSTHPSVEEHAQMAQELLPFFKNLLNS